MSEIKVLFVLKKLFPNGNCILFAFCTVVLIVGLHNRQNLNEIGRVSFEKLRNL